MMDIVVLGLSITSSWGNGHATTYRALLRGLAQHGHRVTFLERDTPWYAANRDMPAPPFAPTILYRDLDELAQYAPLLAHADLTIVGSYVPDGAAVARWALGAARGLVAFYDIDTPVTVAKLARSEHDYLSPDLIPRFDLYLSFTGGPILTQLERDWGARAARALYCSVDEEQYAPVKIEPRWDLGYLGTYSDDRQTVLDRLLCGVARRFDGRFVVAGSQYPSQVVWPANVERIEHVPPDLHASFYSAQRWTLNATRADMVAAGWSPSVRLFEAAACGVPIISDPWPGLDELLLPGREVLIAHTTDDVLQILRTVPDETRRAIGQAARRAVLDRHTATARASELETYVADAYRARSAKPSLRMVRA
jgi:spore maturation protein CgeB